ncbi:DegT/DnrJ/EryC1/StrS family aminotransferase [Sphingosinicella humi]|uniref:Aminotransferase DegT n=1 Tax=Allosphingosinicella humi TaxID=2068657 RepID=A0A2U2J171_9SPHN|nr:DegT/DnrJ/EryC1/StrS family aminotransferase [Sphingosinicella humi]PWG02089.1 aminotransferase DegT [Sphingosinicella humi]
MTIQFIDLAAQQQRLRGRIDQAIGEVLDQGAYIMGPQVKHFEAELARFCGAKHVISCGNGTDALQLTLMALGVGAGDAVLVPTFTFAATAEVVPMIGATPVFVDSDEATFNMDPSSLERAIGEARAQGFNPRVVIPVDLFGLPANMPRIETIAAREGLDVVCDSAQGFGGIINSRMTGTFGRATTTSFFPAKPLGCYGDGGAIFTDDDELGKLIDSLRVHGKGSDKYDNVRVGMNSRLDTLQAAILSVKLSVYADEIEARNRVAARYHEGLSNVVTTPSVPEGYQSVWAQYTIKVADRVERAHVQDSLKAASIPTAVYYPLPLHQQTAYSEYPRDPDGCASADSLSQRVLSLPMHPYLDELSQSRVIDALHEALTAGS